MVFEDVNALHSAINSVCELKLIGMGVIANHCAYFAENLLKSIRTQQDYPE
jgi:hypothetical protein